MPADKLALVESPAPPALLEPLKVFPEDSLDCTAWFSLSLHKSYEFPYMFVRIIR